MFRGPDYTEYMELDNSLPVPTGDRLGFSVTAGDFNHDLVDEIVAGAYAYDAERGAFVVWQAWEDMEVLDLCCDPPVGVGARFGHDVSSGDVTNDVFPDLAISAFRSHPNKVLISYGYDGWGYGYPWIFNQVLESLYNPNYDFFGICLAYCGDVDNDGIGDLIVGACQNGYAGVGNGYAALYCGGDGNIDPDPDFVAFGEAYDDGLGDEVNVRAGDMNGDGYADFAVSAPYYDEGGNQTVGKVYIHGELNLLSSDPGALAYNGNRHFVRIPNSRKMHLVYTCNGKILYSNTIDEGVTWDYTPFELGQGSYPAIALSSAGLPSVTWTDDAGGLWYRRQIQPEEWSDVYHLYNPAVSNLPLNSPPSIAIIPSIPNVVHILVTRSGGIPNGGPKHTVEDYSFPITNPGQGSFELIEQVYGPSEPPLRSFPSLAKCDVDNSLHAVWQRVDTICYATRDIGQPWNNWGWQFFDYGRFSAHPFVETYGDSVFVVWQRKEGFYNYEEVYRAANWIYYLPPQFTWHNFSLTSETASLYPVNASGFFTVLVDLRSPHMNTWWEIYYKTRPQEPLYNISQTPYTWSHYPHSSARFCAISGSYLYTAWLEKPGAAYAIRFKRIHHMPRDMAYLTSSNGHNPSSPYLVARDSCISDWQVPVDIGYATISYQFPLEPGYLYKLKAVAYHESFGEWREWIKIDNHPRHLIKYNAYEPETLEFWIPPAFYQDSLIEVVFERIAGDFAAIGPIYIYRYEYEEGEGAESGGPMAQESQPLSKNSFAIAPNPFSHTIKIALQSQTQKEISVKVYDVAGRLVKNLFTGSINTNQMLTWSGEDENNRVTAQGIYFIRIENLASGETSVYKVLKVK